MDRFLQYLTVFCMAFMMSGSCEAFGNLMVVKPDKLEITHDGLFVNLDGTPLTVESLVVANDGYLVTKPTPRTDICPNCGHEGYIRGRFCPWCNFPDDAKISPIRHVSMD